MYLVPLNCHFKMVKMVKKQTNPRDQALSTSVEGGADQQLVLAIDEIMPRDVHVLIPRTCEHVSEGIKAADGICSRWLIS